MKRYKWIKRIIAALTLFVLASANAALAQRTTAAVYGIVQDSSRAVIPGATVMFTNEATNAAISVVSNEVGEFAVNFVPVGRYTIKAELKGFKTFLQKGVDLTAGQQIRFTVAMEVGQLSETTTVTAEASLVQNATATLTDNINRTQLTQLPLSQRDFTGLLTLQSGVRSAGTGQNAGTFQVNGLAPAGITVTVDGVDSSGSVEINQVSMFQAYNQINVVSLEAIQEVTLSKGVMSAEVAHTYSSNINLISKSGSNKFHGSLFENWQNDILNARSFFATARPLVRRHQFGGSLGGPILKNRAFFFFTYEGYRQKNNQLVSGLTPTPEFKAQASAALPAYKPVLDVFPNPTEAYAPGAVSAFYRGVSPDLGRDNHVVARGDYQLNSTNTLTGRYTRGRPYRIRANFRAAAAVSYTGSTDAGVMTWTRSKPSWTSETRFGVNFIDTSRVAPFYTSNITGLNLQGQFLMEGELLIVTGHSFSVEEIIAKNVGRHTIKIGGMFTDRAPGRFDEEVPIFRYGNAAAMLANNPNQVQFTFGVPRYYARSWDLGFFFQDDFRLRPNIVLNLGMRYEYYSVLKESNNNSYNPGLRENSVKTPPVFRPPDSAYNADFNNILPRVGIAWGMGKDQKTVVRSGFGMSVAPLDLGSAGTWAKIAVDIPSRVQFTGSDITNFKLKYPLSNTQGLEIMRTTSAPRAYSGFDENNRNPYTMQWTLDVQRALTPTLVVQSGYVGNKGVKIIMYHRYNEPDRITNVRPFPQYTQSTWVDAGDSSWYHGWQTMVRKRFANDYAFNMHYTWSKSMSISAGDITSVNNPRVQDENNWRADQSPTPWDRTHEFNFDAIYTPGFDRWLNASGMLREIIGGWQITGIMRAGTGAPITVLQTNARESQRPDYAGGDPYLHPSDISGLYLNKAAFTLVPVSPVSGITVRPGNMGSRSLRAPGLWSVDMNIGKTFRIREGVGLQIRIDIFNAFNHANWGDPNADVTSSLFGRITTTSDARSMQIAARLAF